MCGIVGYISNTDKLYEGPKAHFMRYALALDTLRGPDSTGLITLRKKFKVYTAKTLMPGDRFVHSKEWQKEGRPGWAQIGHNRAATRGEINIDNAHPFQFKDITMVHNGTLWNDGKSLKTYDKSLPVDSMQIALALSIADPDEAGEVLTAIDGAYALVWTDKRDESINMARNSERPLHIAFNDRKSIMWYMSDGHHLHSINKSFGNHECKAGSIFEMDQHKLLKFKKGAMKPEVIKFDPFVRKVTPAKQSFPITTKKSTTTGSKPTANTALTVAQNKWKMRSEKGSRDTSHGTQTTTGGEKLSDVQVPLMGKMRKVPACMQNALRKELQLCPDDMLQFQPNDAVQLEDNRWIVYGGLILTGAWNDMVWDCTIYNVPNAQYNAYKETDWLVRPIGLCASHEFDQKNPAILGALVHTDWDGYNVRCLAVTEEEEGDDDPKLLVPGPGGHLILWSKLKPMLDSGCINCSGDLEKGPIKDLMPANNGQDLLCPPCQHDLKGYLNDDGQTVH